MEYSTFILAVVASSLNIVGDSALSYRVGTPVRMLLLDIITILGTALICFIQPIYLISAIFGFGTICSVGLPSDLNAIDLHVCNLCVIFISVWFIVSEGKAGDQ